MARKLCFTLSASIYKSNRRHLHASGSRFKIVPFVLSDIGEGIKEVTVRDWFVKVGDRVKQFDDICLVESDKAAVNITSRFDGVIAKVYHEEGATALVGRPLVDIDTDEGPASEVVSDESEQQKSGEKRDAAIESSHNSDGLHPVSQQPSAASHEEQELLTHKERALATPAVRRLAKEHNVALNNVTGSGKSGRVLKEDVLRFVGNKSAGLEGPTAGHEEKKTAGDRVVPVTGIKRAMAKAMTKSHAIPSFGYSDELEVTKLVELRKEIKSQIKGDGVNVTYMPFLIKALSNALLHHPELNAHVDDNCENVTIKSEHNVGLAIDTANGLLVPNIKSVQMKSVLEISFELNRLIEKAKNRTLSVQDLSGGTITISNIGIVGGTYVRPLINPPEVAIVGVGRFRRRPVFDENDRIVAAHTCNASWSADHRVIDGAALARFAELWKHYVENPLKILIDA